MFYFLIPIISAGYVILFHRKLITRNWIKAVFLKIIFCIVLSLGVHIYLCSLTQGRIIWKEVFVYAYFFASVNILLFLMKLMFKKIANFVSARVENPKLNKFISSIIVVALWTFIFFPYILATFTIHRPKIGDNYNPESILILEYENITLHTQDGVRIRGWFVPSKGSKKAVLIGHGLGANKSNFLGLVDLWHSLNYNVLIFDFRGHGESDGHTISFGYKEKYDIKAGFEYLVRKKNFAPENIVGYGVSFGGASLIHAVSDSVNFDRIVTDSSFANIDTMADKVIERMGFVPSFLRGIVKNIGLAFVSLELGFDIDKSSPLNVVDKIDKPWLIIHGKKDILIPCEEALVLYDNVNTRKKLYLVDVGGHYTTLEDKEYINQLNAFLKDFQ